jgi:mono/diheme cytochrome c family protein
MLKTMPAWLLALIFSACSSSNETSSSSADAGSLVDAGSLIDAGSLAVAPTYYQDVAPILQAKCVACHSAGKIAPFALDAPELAKAQAPAIKEVVNSGTMPPWPPGPLSPAMLHARSLSAAQIATLTAWANAKAPLGDATRPAAPGVPDVVDIGTADLAFDIGVDYTADSKLTDDYRCFLVNTGATENRIITGYRITPGNSKTVHHVITTLFAASDKAELEAIDAASPGPGWTCFGGAIPSTSNIKPDGSLGAWVPGVSSVILPAGTGGIVRSGDLAVVQVHYNVLADKGPDRTKLEMKFAPKGTAAGIQTLTTLRLFKRDLFLPANKSKIVQEKTLSAADWVGGKFYADGQAQILMVAGHMHTLGTHLTIERKNSQGTSVLLDIPAWDFHWQGSYLLAKPIVLAATDQLTIRCIYENTVAQREANEWEPGAVENIQWGEGTHDEMCIGYVTVVNKPPVTTSGM